MLAQKLEDKSEVITHFNTRIHGRKKQDGNKAGGLSTPDVKSVILPEAPY